MKYTVYFDESYNQPQKDNANVPLVYTIAGCVSTDVHWAKFQKKWNLLLNEELSSQWRNLYGAEATPFFHMTDFNNPHSKLYGSWAPNRRQGFLAKLHGLMNRYSIKRFATCISVNDYQLLTTGEKFVFGSPHVAAAINCMKLIMAWADHIGLQDPMRYVFEEGSLYDKELRRLYEQVMTDAEKTGYRIAELAFKNKRELAPLQAADILAVESRLEYHRRLNANNSRSIRKSALNLFNSSIDEWCYWDSTHFSEILSRDDIQTAMNTEEFSDAVTNAKKRKLNKYL